MNRVLVRLALGLLLALAGVLAWLWTPDIPHATLVERYGGPESRFVGLPSGAVAHYRVQGSANGPTLVLLHGSNASLHTWEPWVVSLGDAMRIVTVDLPGHGLTGPVPDGEYTYTGFVRFLREFTQAIELNKFILGGNSMGGGTALAYALAHPEQLQGLVLVDAAGLDLPFGEGSKADLPLAFRLAGTWYADWALTRITPRAIVAEGLRKSFQDPGLVDEGMVQRYWELARHPGNRAATGQRFAWYRDGRRPLDIEAVRLPALVIWGERDRLIPLAVGEEMHRRIAGSEFVVLPGVGHLPQEEAVVASAAAVRAFAARVGATAPATDGQSGASGAAPEMPADDGAQPP